MRTYKYVKIEEVLSRVLREPLMADVTIEQAVQYAIDFVSLFGIPQMYMEKECKVHIHNYMGELPCDLVHIRQVKNRHGRCLRAMTDTFKSSPLPAPPIRGRALPDGIQPPKSPHRGLSLTGYMHEGVGFEDTFRVQNNVIYVNFAEGEVEVSYLAIPVDENGFPMLPDNAVFLKTLELYIQCEVFGSLFRNGKVTKEVLADVRQEYAFRAGQCQSEFTIPDVNEMEAIKNMWTSLIQNGSYFYRGFKRLGDRERFLKH